jgi:hypothetical protein
MIAAERNAKAATSRVILKPFFGAVFNIIAV